MHKVKKLLPINVLKWNVLKYEGSDSRQWVSRNIGSIVTKGLVWLVVFVGFSKTFWVVVVYDNHGMGQENENSRVSDWRLKIETCRHETDSRKERHCGYHLNFTDLNYEKEKGVGEKIRPKFFLE